MHIRDAYPTPSDIDPLLKRTYQMGDALDRLQVGNGPASPSTTSPVITPSERSAAGLRCRYLPKSPLRLEK